MLRTLKSRNNRSCQKQEAAKPGFSIATRHRETDGLREVLMHAEEDAISARHRLEELENDAATGGGIGAGGDSASALSMYDAAGWAGKMASLEDELAEKKHALISELAVSGTRLQQEAEQSLRVQGLSLEDGAATLAMLTVRSIGLAVAHFPAPPDQWIVCGGGRLNHYLIDCLEREVPGVVTRSDDLGWNGDAIEAQAFAYLAIRSILGLPISFPGTTGVAEPLTGGSFNAPKNPDR